MSVKLLANDGLSQAGVDLLKRAGITIITDKVEQANLIDYINKEQISGVLVRSATTVRRDIIDACPSIKLIGRGGVGMDNIDVAYAREKGIKVVNTPASSSQSVAELVIAHMFSLARMTHDSYRNMPEKGALAFNDLKKKYGKGTELRGKTIGILGFGRIGQSVAKYALGLGMDVLAYDTTTEERAVSIEIAGQKVEVKITPTALQNVLSKSDYITIHIPAQPDGAAAIGASDISQMKKGAYLINAARGGVLDEGALLSALDAGQLAGAALDVFVGEPTPRKDVLLHPKVISTPHIGAATVEAQDRIGEEMANLVIEYFF
ncbi:MAG: D-2-hydroxyacid dehydrogenase [Flavobacteriales bacterium]